MRRYDFNNLKEIQKSIRELDKLNGLKLKRLTKVVTNRCDNETYIELMAKYITWKTTDYILFTKTTYFFNYDRSIIVLRDFVSKLD